MQLKDILKETMRLERIQRGHGTKEDFEYKFELLTKDMTPIEKEMFFKNIEKQKQIGMNNG